MRTVIGVMGGGVADEATRALAHEVGALIAAEGWVLLNGGRDCGVMAASAAGAASAGGLVVGILPDDNFDGVAAGVDIAIPTGMGDARNVINILASHVVIALPGGAGTLSEVAHALKAGRPVVVVGWDPGEALRAAGGSRLTRVDSAADAIAAAKRFLGEPRARSRVTH
ncbi:MAG: TIGR00725 family protein [Anaerosomatales bacterium]|nr:TIGR00725 family protein [Anaerosomatales bacterium]